MEQFPENDIPIYYFFIGFAILMYISRTIRLRFRHRNRLQEGQLYTEGDRVPSIEERVANNRAWASGEIRSNGLKFTIVMWIFALTWNLTFGVSFFKFLFNPESKTGPIVVLGIFALAGVGIAAFAARVTWRHFRFGESLCCIRGKAGVLGKVMEGVVKTKTEIKAIGDYSILLQCLEHYHTGSGENRKSKTDIRWQGKQTVPHTGKNSQIGIPFSFDIPSYPPETGYQLSRGTITWQLSISAPVEGVDYSAVFLVPVFKMD